MICSHTKITLDKKFASFVPQRCKFLSHCERKTELKHSPSQGYWFCNLLIIDKHNYCSVYKIDWKGKWGSSHI